MLTFKGTTIAIFVDLSIDLSPRKVKLCSLDMVYMIGSFEFQDTNFCLSLDTNFCLSLDTNFCLSLDTNYKPKSRKLEKTIPQTN